MLSMLLSGGGVHTDSMSKIANLTFSEIVKVVNIILPVIMSVLLVIGLYYGIILGVKYAKAESDDDKKKAKDSLVNVIVGVLIAIIFIAVVQIILNSGFVSDLFGGGVNPTL